MTATGREEEGDSTISRPKIVFDPVQAHTSHLFVAMFVHTMSQHYGKMEFLFLLSEVFHQ